MTPHLTLLKNLIRSSSKLWQLVKFKDQWGKTMFYIPHVDYDDALAAALDELDKDLESAGIIYVWDENVN